jgi:hypothetical protein
MSLYDRLDYVLWKPRFSNLGVIVISLLLGIALSALIIILTIVFS